MAVAVDVDVAVVGGGGAQFISFFLFADNQVLIIWDIVDESYMIKKMIQEYESGYS